LQERFGRISIRSAYRSPTVNQYGNDEKLGCASNMKNHAKHIWDYKDENGHTGAMATIVINSLIPYFEKTRNWQALAWYIHDHLPYSTLCFYPKLGAFNIGWHESSLRRIDSHVKPTGCLTRSGMANHSGSHYEEYNNLLKSFPFPK